VSLVALKIDGSVGVIVVDNPPVNALSNAVRVGLVTALEDAGRNAAIEAVVLSCAGRTFIAGADISEFGQPPREPTTLDVIAAIEAMRKPVVAALFEPRWGGVRDFARLPLRVPRRPARAWPCRRSSST
jgi:3-hydroxyacyl-CoA dehydrogenase